MPPIRLTADATGLPVAAQQHLVQQYCGVCHNYEDYAGGVETVPTGNLLLSILGMFDVQAECFGDSTGPLQNI